MPNQNEEYIHTYVYKLVLHSLGTSLYFELYQEFLISQLVFLP